MHGTFQSAHHRRYADLNRLHAMKRRSKDAAESSFHEIKGRLMDAPESGRTTPALDTRSVDDRVPERVLHLIGRFENFLGE